MKPPILSDEQMFNIREEQGYRAKEHREKLACLICGNRDACRIFPHQPTEQTRGDVCSMCLNDMESADRVIDYYEPLIEQAKAEVAREIVEKAKFIILHLDSQHGFIKRLEASPDWQSLKSKYTGGKK